MRWVRRLYDWVLSWANTRYGTPALFILSFTEASIFPIPPDVLLMPLCLGKRERAFYYAFVCSVASVLGGILGYAIGWGAWSAVNEFFFTYVPGFTPEKFADVKGVYDRWDFWVVFVAAFTPLPYKIITIAAGVFAINFPMFMVASAVGRSARFFLVAGMIHYFGAPVERFIDRWFDLLAVAFTLLLILGFVALKYIGH